MTKIRTLLKIVLAVCLLLVLVGCAVYYNYFCLLRNAHPNSIDIKSASISDNILSLKGEIHIGSAQVFGGYSYEEKNSCIYITIKYVIGSKPDDSAHFSMDIPLEKVQDVKEVYLTDGEAEKLIFVH